MMICLLAFQFPWKKSCLKRAQSLVRKQRSRSFQAHFHLHVQVRAICRDPRYVIIHPRKLMVLISFQTEPIPSQAASLTQAMNLLNIKSEEIAMLKAAEAANASKLEKMQVTIITHRDAMDAVSLSLSETKERLAAEKMAWEAERIALHASLAESAKATAAAEKDRDFFREQYAQASGFVGAVRQENVELEQRVAIAEGQTKDGIYMIKATYDAQVKALQAEVVQANWRTDILRTQSLRTDSEIRRKAGEHPGLVEQYEESLEECSMLNATIDELRRDRKALQDKLHKKDQQLLLGLTGDGLRVSDGSSLSEGGEHVYRCEWRPGGDMNACLDVFGTHEVFFFYFQCCTFLLILFKRC